MNATKIKLSTTELSLVTKADFILTKNAVIEKVYALFGQMATVFAAELATNKLLPKEVIATQVGGMNFKESINVLAPIHNLLDHHQLQ